MKYVLTGSIGHISKIVAKNLVSKGHEVSIITSKPGNESAITDLGAKAAVGSVEDSEFLQQAFTNADAVYLMIPPKWDITNWLSYQQAVADNYVEAVKKNAVKNVVVLSSIGAHMGTGAGPVDGLAYLETKLNALPDVNAIYLRPSYFFYNLFSMIPLVKNAGIMGTNQPGNDRVILTDHTDIAAVATERLLDIDHKGKDIVYIASDERSWNEIATVLSRAIGKENIPWVEFTDEQALDGMLQAGLPETIAKGYANMGAALRSGEMQADYRKHAPSKLGTVKLEDFAKEFVAAYNN